MSRSLARIGAEALSGSTTTLTVLKAGATEKKRVILEHHSLAKPPQPRLIIRA